MAILVEGFSLVARLATIDARHPGGWERFREELPTERVCFDAELVGVHCGSRKELREVLGWFAGAGWWEAAAILATTELSSMVRLPAQIEAIRAVQGACAELALVYRHQERRVPWLEVVCGPLPGGGPVVAGAYLAGGPRGELALPERWAWGPERGAIDPRQLLQPLEDPDDLDEGLPTWLEFVGESDNPEVRASLLASGPGFFHAYTQAVGTPKMVASGARPAGVIEQECVVTDPDGKERTMVARWTKL